MRHSLERALACSSIYSCFIKRSGGGESLGGGRKYLSGEFSAAGIINRDAKTEGGCLTPCVTAASTASSSVDGFLQTSSVSHSLHFIFSLSKKHLNFYCSSQELLGADGEIIGNKTAI